MMNNKVIANGMECNGGNGDSVQETDIAKRKRFKAQDFIYHNDRVLAFVADVFNLYSTSQDELTENAAFGMYLLLENWRERGKAIMDME